MRRIKCFEVLIFRHFVDSAQRYFALPKCLHFNLKNGQTVTICWAGSFNRDPFDCLIVSFLDKFFRRCCNFGELLESTLVALFTFEVEAAAVLFSGLFEKGFLTADGCLKQWAEYREMCREDILSSPSSCCFLGYFPNLTCCISFVR